MKVFGSISRLVSILFRKDGQDIALKPNQSTTYSQARSFELPVGDSDHELVGKDASQTLSNKSMDGDSNSFSNIGISSFKTELSDADKVLLRDVSGAVVSSKLENKHIADGADIDVSKLASVTASRVLVSDVSGKLSASSITSAELDFLSGVSSNVQDQLDSKASQADMEALTTDDIAEGSRLYFTDARAKAAAVQDSDFSTIDSSSSVETLNSLPTDVAPSVQAVAEAIKDILDGVDVVDGKAVANDTLVKAVRDAAGLAVDGSFSGITGSNYLKSGDFSADSLTATLKNALKLLDSKIYQKDEAAQGYATAAQSAAISSANNYTDTKIGDLVGGAPALLDTLKELSDALGGDADFATNISTSIASKISKPTDGSEGANKYLRINADGSTYWDAGFDPGVLVHKETWATASGSSLVITHGLNSSDVQVSLIDLEDGQQIGIDSISIDSNSQITLSASEAPSASGWRVMVQKL